jgi:hypothetical protein
MADFANLVLCVDTSGLKRSERTLDDTTCASANVTSIMQAARLNCRWPE